MDSRACTYFIAVVEHGGISRAAEHLHVTQPTLSIAIRKLEEDLGAPLFHRVGRGIVLSEAGRALVEPARHVIHDIAEIEETMNALRGLRGGRVRVAAPPGVSAHPLARLIGTFHALHPDVIISLLPAEDGAIAVEAVQTASCDIALVDRVITSSELVVHTISQKQILLASPPGSPAGGPIDLSKLDGQPFISGFPGTRARAVLDQARNDGIDLRIVVETPHREATIPLILEGVGSAFLTETAARDAERRGAVIRPLRPALTYDVHLVHREGSLTRAASAFVGHALERSPVPHTPATPTRPDPTALPR